MSIFKKIILQKYIFWVRKNLLGENWVDNWGSQEVGKVGKTGRRRRLEADKNWKSEITRFRFTKDDFLWMLFLWGKNWYVQSQGQRLSS